MLETERTEAIPPVEATTQGVRVRVVSKYLAHQSAPASNRFVFSYEVTITNEGQETVQLRTRHWIITDGNQRVEEVRGEGVVGEKPVLEPGQSFQYTSGCILKTTFGTMHGTYQMYRKDGSRFDAEIPAFLLAAPFARPAGAPS
ncbi:MAG: Co2+/Mg2+ efflux protein ApaG [Myxococcales bacterium]|nr:Co2+/Mg2+ efflux protein ApaG [Myxococcales bacterium]